MNIPLTPEQLEHLVKLATLGHWLANSWRTDEDRHEEYDRLLEHVLSAAAENGLDRLVAPGEGDKGPAPSEELEEALQPLIDFYNDNTFWDELIYRLADRDYARKYGDEALDELETEAGQTKEEPLLRKYEKEFDAFGLDRVEIRRDH